jgi:hypothetical protein
MLLYPSYKAKIVGTYYYEDRPVKIKLAGIIMSDSIWIYEYDGQGNQSGRFEGKITEDGSRFQGIWHRMDGAGESQFDLELIATFAGLPNNIYQAAGAKSTAEVEQFAQELKEHILAQNKIQVAERIAYPIQVEIEGKRQTIKTRQEFMARFGQIFNADFISSIQTCFPLNMESYKKGIKFGDQGQLWLGYVKNTSGRELKVIGINNSNKF